MKRARAAAAVDNFLASLNGLTAQEAFANLRQDARSYKWSAATINAIARGITRHFARSGKTGCE